MFKWVYHVSRVIFGGWWLYSGLMHFLVEGWQPMGQEPEAIAFTQALIDSGLFTWVKLIEVVLGITILMDRWMPATIAALTPINIVILYWNFVLEVGTVEYVFGTLSAIFNVILFWPWRRYFWPLLSWRGQRDYSARLGLPD